MNFILIQLIGAIAYIILSLSYHRKKKKEILFMEIISHALFATHYYLLNGISGTICNIIGLFSLIIIYLFEQYKINNKIPVVVFLIIILIFINTLTFQNIFSIFPIIALIISISSFLFDSENLIRKMGLLSATCWLIYAIIYKSYISILFEGIVLISTYFAYLNNRKKLKRKGV